MIRTRTHLHESSVLTALVVCDTISLIIESQGGLYTQKHQRIVNKTFASVSASVTHNGEKTKSFYSPIFWTLESSSLFVRRRRLKAIGYTQDAHENTARGWRRYDFSINTGKTAAAAAAVSVKFPSFFFLTTEAWKKHADAAGQWRDEYTTPSVGLARATNWLSNCAPLQRAGWRWPPGSWSEERTIYDGGGLWYRISSGYLAGPLFFLLCRSHP